MHGTEQTRNRYQVKIKYFSARVFFGAFTSCKHREFMASIIFEKGVDKGSIYSLEGYDLVLFGRGEHCQIIVRDPLASRAHFTIEVVGGKFMLLDQESYNGTYVNGESIGADPQRLENFDRIEFGGTSTRVHWIFMESQATISVPRAD